jgi:hypothetical protein
MIRKRNRRWRNIALTFGFIVVAAVTLFGLTLQARDVEYGEARCSQVTITHDGLTPVSWEPVGWRVEDGFTALSCPSVGAWWHLEEDGTISPR